jgi:hypothetical protein
MVMEAAEFRKCDYPTAVRRMQDPRVRRVHRQGKVRPPIMVVGKIPSNDAPELTLVQSDNMIEAVPS